MPSLVEICFFWRLLGWGVEVAKGGSGVLRVSGELGVGVGNSAVGEGVGGPGMPMTLQGCIPRG